METIKKRGIKKTVRNRTIKSYEAFTKSCSAKLFIKNRLENNSEHWNALLLSLRELTEWVIRKDTELSTLGVGPVRGDAASLQKQLHYMCCWFWLFFQ
uniref:Uncharacterized protein n=1 Tax=Glossina pallidipes TaxID=7398 RepID=A0A1A9ZXW4_GLOPL